MLTPPMNTEPQGAVSSASTTTHGHPMRRVTRAAMPRAWGRERDRDPTPSAHASSLLSVLAHGIEVTDPTAQRANQTSQSKILTSSPPLHRPPGLLPLRPLGLTAFTRHVNHIPFAYSSSDESGNAALTTYLEKHAPIQYDSVGQRRLTTFTCPNRRGQGVRDRG